MRALFLDPSNTARTAATSLVTVAALALLGLVLAYWTWTWFAPRPVPRAHPGAQAGDLTPAAYGLFGNAQQGRNGAAASGGTVKLLGVVAATGSRSGYAVLRLDAKRTTVVREGGEIEPGARLAEVHADHVVLERDGRRESLAWPERDKAATAGATRARN